MQRCALAGLAVFAMVSLAASDDARWQRSFSPAYLGGGPAIQPGLQVPVPVGSCFVSENTHAEFTGREQVESHVTQVREMAREIARLNDK